MKSEFIELDGKQVRLLEQHQTNPDYKTEKQQVFIIGSKGIPAAYGGFETFVDKLTEYRSDERIRYHVARMGDRVFRYEYHDAKCFNVKVPQIGPAKAVYYDLAALRTCINYCKARPSIRQPVFYILACRIGPFMRHYRKKIEALGGKLYVNPDGHEWKRAKWNALIRRYWKYSEKLMVKNAGLLICDSKNIEQYIRDDYAKYHPNTTYIAYGCETQPSALKEDDEKLKAWYQENGLCKGSYYLVVGRFVPENNYETMIREFMASDSTRDFAIITALNEKLSNELEQKLHYSSDPRIKFVGTVYDQELLKKIRENAYGYFHGHEVGGTNPSLLEALGATELNLLLDVGFNREVAEDSALYWTKEPGSLARLIEQADAMPQEERLALGSKAHSRMRDAFSWEFITKRYEDLFLKDYTGDEILKNRV